MRFFTLLFGILIGAVLHHHLVKDRGSHNPFDSALDRGEAKAKAKIAQVRDSDAPQTTATQMAQDALQKAADTVGDTAEAAAEKAADATN